MMHSTRSSGLQTHLKPTVHIDSLPELAPARQRALGRPVEVALTEGLTSTDETVTDSE